MNGVFFVLLFCEVIFMFSMSAALPNAVEVEKKLISAMMLKESQIVPLVSSILEPDDFYRPEHQIIYRSIVRIFFQGTPPDVLAIEQDLRKSGELDKIDRAYLFSLIDMEYTTARAEFQANTIKEKSYLRKLIHAAEVIIDESQRETCQPAEIISGAMNSFDRINRSAQPSKSSSFSDFFAHDFDSEIENMKNYANRLTGFDNLDAAQFFSPGLYVIGATPAAGKTTFCWQLLEQLARKDETCIYCSYEMSRLELFAKSLARELFRRDSKTALTAAQIRRGGVSRALREVISVFANLGLNLSVLELQDESIDDLLALLKPFCSNKEKAPVVCLDYLQIVPTSRESTKLGIDDSVRKLKKFQRDTNTTFIVISSFNRTNYAHTVSFESFKESGNIEYTADVVWALQLNLMNELKSYNDIADTRKRIDDAKKQQPRQINLKCLKNRQGTKYDCFFRYYSAHDCFESCDHFDENDLSLTTSSCNNDRR